MTPSPLHRYPRSAHNARLIRRAVEQRLPESGSTEVVETLRDMFALARAVHREAWLSAGIFADEALRVMNDPPCDSLAARLAKLDAAGFFLVVACRHGVVRALGRLDGRYVARLAIDLSRIASAPAAASEAAAVARSAAVREFVGRARLRTWLRARGVRELHRLETRRETEP